MPTAHCGCRRRGERGRHSGRPRGRQRADHPRGQESAGHAPATQQHQQVQNGVDTAEMAGVVEAVMKPPHVCFGARVALPRNQHSRRGDHAAAHAVVEHGDPPFGDPPKGEFFLREPEIYSAFSIQWTAQFFFHFQSCKTKVSTGRTGKCDLRLHSLFCSTRPAGRKLRQATRRQPKPSEGRRLGLHVRMYIRNKTTCPYDGWLPPAYPWMARLPLRVVATYVRAPPVEGPDRGRPYVRSDHPRRASRGGAAYA